MFDKLRPTVRFQASVENNEVVYPSWVSSIDIMELCDSATRTMTTLATISNPQVAKPGSISWRKMF